MLANGGTVIGHENWRTHVISPHIESHKSKSRLSAVGNVQKTFGSTASTAVLETLSSSVGA
jgi:hypothetical protein